MKISANSPENYIDKLPDDRKNAIKSLRQVILRNLPQGFEEMILYGMITYVVPHSTYKKGYHVDPNTPLPFISIASQKNYIAFYHMGIYADQNLQAWFKSEYPKYSIAKLDMGKSCIRFKNPENIPYDLLAELVKKISPETWIKTYESKIHHVKK